jgi:hypothetical protein
MFHNVKPITTTYHIYHQVSLISVAGSLEVAPSLAAINGHSSYITDF